ncbi:DUF4145 domain-containing protein [Heyndrickxia ginsengihumi]|uniref:DUF4145 domain-containing protein n=1 Tax=Bacillaceae TaxID=186817 RepID=UPI00046FAA02|nr:DUF4145 domain-containing protein [Heyndrickxia ginsengihumi]
MSEKIILTCPHCGNKTPMELLNRFEKVTKVPLQFSEKAHFHDIFEVFECPVCKGFQLFHTHWNTEEAYREGFDIYEEGSVLFPTSEKVNLYSLPKNIKGAYESALKVKNIDNAVCVMALRRTFEMVCKDKGAVNGQLHQKLNQLQQQGILPPLKGDISKVIKDFGNMAAHGDQVNFDKYMVESMFRFTNKILEYIYILPREMKRARQELEDLAEEAESQANATN